MKDFSEVTDLETARKILIGYDKAFLEGAAEHKRIRARAQQLESGPGGIMEMKQTIADKEKRIAELEDEVMEWKARAISMFHLIPGDVTVGEVKNARDEVLQLLKETAFPNIDKVITVLEKQPDFSVLVEDNDDD
jgi:hypothetical protein